MDRPKPILRTAVCGMLSILFAAASVQTADERPLEAGFVSMFNGQDLAGWKTTGNWLVEESGVVTLDPRPGEHGWKRYDAHLTTASGSATMPHASSTFLLRLAERVTHAGVPPAAQ